MSRGVDLRSLRIAGGYGDVRFMNSRWLTSRSITELAQMNGKHINISKDEHCLKRYVHTNILVSVELSSNPPKPYLHTPQTQTPQKPMKQQDRGINPQKNLFYITSGKQSHSPNPVQHLEIQTDPNISPSTRLVAINYILYLMILFHHRANQSLPLSSFMNRNRNRNRNEKTRNLLHIIIYYNL